MLQLYVEKQDALICEHLRKWVAQTAEGGPVEMRPFVQRLNALTSQEVFAGASFVAAAVSGPTLVLHHLHEKRLSCWTESQRQVCRPRGPCMPG